MVIPFLLEYALIADNPFAYFINLRLESALSHLIVHPLSRRGLFRLENIVSPKKLDYFLAHIVNFRFEGQLFFFLLFDLHLHFISLLLNEPRFDQPT